MITKPEENEQSDNCHLATDKEIIRRLAKDFSLFGGLRGEAIVLYYQCLVSYTRAKIENLETSPDIAILIAIANTMRELQGFVSNPIKDAIDRNDSQRVQDLHRVALMTGINPALVTWVLNQTYVIVLPYLGRNADQLWILPTTTVFCTWSLMALTAEYTYGSMRNPIHTLCIFAGSAPIMFASMKLLNLIDNTATTFTLAGGMSSTFFVICSLIYLEKKYPDEHLFKNIFATSQWKASYKEACHINKLGIQSAFIVSSEVVASIILNQLLNPTSLAAYQPMASTVIGIGSALSLTFQQRVQFHTRHILNKLENNPVQMRRALRKLLIHSTWLSLIIPTLTGTVAIAASDVLTNILYNVTPDKQAIVTEAQQNVLLVFILLAERFAMAGPNGMIFAVRNSLEPYHQWLNKYSSITRIITPLASVAVGASLDYFFNMGSTSYWLGGIAVYAASNIINASFAWKLIEYEYNRGMKLNNTPVEKSSYCPSFWGKSSSPKVEYVPMTNISTQNKEELVVVVPEPQSQPSYTQSTYNFFANSRSYISEKVSSVRRYFGFSDDMH